MVDKGICRTNSIGSLPGLFLGYIRLNLLSQMSYRIAFISQFFFMLLNDVFLLFFWWVFFSGFKPAGGWELRDVFLLYAVSAGVFGITAVFFGRAFTISKMIQQGELDNYLLNPAPVLPHIVISSSIAAGWGDIAFSMIAFFMAGYLNTYSIFMYLFSLVSGTLIFLSFLIFFNSLAFFIESADGITKLMREALLTFSMYPGDLFSGTVKILLFTVIPAGFMAYIPVGLIKNFNLFHVVIVMLFSIGMLLFSAYFFYSGLRKYSSGNIMVSRG